MGHRVFTKFGLRLAGLVLSACVLPSAVHAAGLGRLTVLSALGQPLRAEIEINAVQPAEADSLKAGLAPQEAYRQANIEQNSALYDLRMDVQRRDGQFLVVLTSVRPLNEPFLDLLLELNWQGGRLTREYTFLLDPPEYRGAATAQAVAPVAPPVVQSLPPQRPAASPSTVPAEAPRSSAAPAATASSSSTYQVKKGDTLAKIARSSAGSGVSVQQMLVALYRANQDAFMGSNMNRLRAGRILNIPDREAVLSISAAEANRIVNSQGTEYADYQRSVGAAVAAAPERPEGTRQSAGRITPPAEQKAPATKEAPKDQLRLAKPDDTKAGGRAAAAASADDAAAKDKSLREAQERIASLEKNIADLEKLRTLKSAPAAQAQQQAEAKGAESKGAPKAEPAKAAEAPKAPAEASKAEAAKAEAPKAAADAKGAPASDAAKAPEAPKAAPPAPAPSTEPGKAPDAAKSDPTKAAPKATPAKAAPVPAVVEKDLVDELLDNEYAIGGAVAVVLLLIGYGFYAWRRKKQNAEQRFSASVMGTAPVLGATSSMGLTGAQSIDTSSTTGAMDFSAPAASKAQAEEIDPVAEADVYMAYGRDAQAEEILKESLNKDASRRDVRLKLMEIYANRKDVNAFATNARELHTVTGGQGPEWEKAAALGLQIDPANALYGGAGAAAADAGSLDTQVLDITAEAVTPEPAVAPPLDFDLDGGTPGVAGEAPVAAEEPAASALDFDLDLGDDKPADAAPVAERTPEPATDTSGGLDFDLGMGGDKPAEVDASKAEGPTPAPAPDSGSMIDFDLDLGEPASPAVVEEPKPEAPAVEEPKAPDFDLSAITLDLGTETPTPGAPVDAKWQEVATKLDLAKAYEEMGDKDGARDLLNEVVKEGDNAQQEQAKSMLATLG